MLGRASGEFPSPRNLRRAGLLVPLLGIAIFLGADVTRGNSVTSDWKNLPEYSGAMLSGTSPNDTLVVTDPKHRKKKSRTGSSTMTQFSLVPMLTKP